MISIISITRVHILLCARVNIIDRLTPTRTQSYIIQHSNSMTSFRGNFGGNISSGDSSSMIYFLDVVESTMDEAKLIARSSAGVSSCRNGTGMNTFAVIANHQSKGRGSKGRVWAAGANNLYMTVMIKMNQLRVPLMLLPLRIGTIVRESMKSTLLPEDVNPQLKWPNDILIDGKKVSGVLIEIENGNVYIGIGCNVGAAPVVEAVVGDRGGARQATCLAIYKEKEHQPKGDMQSVGEEEQDHLILGKEIMNRINLWLRGDEGMDSAERTIRDFSLHMDTAVQYLRDDKYDGSSSKAVTVDDIVKNSSIDGANHSNRTDGISSPPRTEREAVLPLYLHADGTLQVRVVATQEEKTLTAEYLW